MGTRRRQQRKFRRSDVPEHVKASDSREPSLLATSPNVLKQHEARRGLPIMVPPTVKMFGMHKLSKDEVLDLLIDMRYQREEVTDEVNSLITVLKRGGVIPDPISVAERKYGDRRRYIVDGQQRWWAHVDCGLPLNAVIYHVSSFEDEVALFHALNIQTRVTPEKRLASWPGHAGDAIRRLNESEASPLRGKIAFGLGGSSRYGAMILLRGLTALISNTRAVGGLDRVAPTFDRWYKTNPRMADRMIDAYASIVSQVFDGKGKMRQVTAVAIARMCFAAWTDNPVEMPMPTGRQMARLRAIDWDSLTPSHSMKWLPTVAAQMQEVWPVQLVAERKE